MTFEIIGAIAFIASLVFIVFRQRKKATVKSSFSMEMVDESKEDGIKLTLGDIAGNDEAKESVEDIIEFMKNPEKFEKYGARIPHGIIFHGPPGTGKTLMAKAIAGECGISFYAVSGSDFVEMYAGVGANRIRKLFKKAKTDGKAVIFIDEIDAIGKKRSAQSHGASDERDQTLNALLTEMSGFKSGDNVLVIAATNRLDTLDEALLRPGRFDRIVEIGLPDAHTRLSILKHHTKNKPLAMEVSLDELAKETVFFSGAMLENYLNESAILSAKDNAHFIEKKHLDKAYYTIIAGCEKKFKSASFEKEKHITAYHESGHALTTILLNEKPNISKLTIIPTTKGAGGFMLQKPDEKLFYTKNDLETQIKILLSGRVSEEIIFGKNNITTGASNDLENATKIARDLIAVYGMSEEVGLVNLQHFSVDLEVMKECKNLLERLYLEVKDMLESNLETLHLLASELIEKESLYSKDLTKYCNRVLA